MPNIILKPAAVSAAAQNVAVEEVVLSSAVSRLKNAMGSLEEVFVNRTEEIAAITLAIVSGQHILFEGEAGVAKSDLARECFNRITGNGLVIYDKMFGKGTKEDDVFGPVDMIKYRQNAEWSHNTAGSLAACHFANLEELGRASDLLLPSMMTVLNERLFHNGPKVQKCPLITAVASTNFLVESDELAAFNDRWLIRMVVSPLDSNQKCIEMMNRSLLPRPKPKEFITLNEIIALNQAAQSLPIEEEILPLYVDLVKSYTKALTSPSLKISDRRLVHTFRLVRAAALLDERKTVTADDLAVVKYGVSICGKDDESVFNTALQRIVGNVAAVRQENKEIGLMEKYLQKIQDSYDPTLESKELKGLLADANKLVEGMRVRTKPIIVPGNNTRFSDLLNRADNLRSTITENLKNR